MLTPDTAWDLARAWYREKVHPHWRRHTPEETEGLFQSLGLTDPFWRLR